MKWPRCVYCGHGVSHPKTRTCGAHADLPKLDPVYRSVVLTRRADREKQASGAR